MEVYEKELKEKIDAFVAYCHSRKDDPKLWATLEALYYNPVENDEDLEILAGNLLDGFSGTFLAPDDEPFDLEVFQQLPNLTYLHIESIQELDLRPLVGLNNLNVITIMGPTRSLPLISTSVKYLTIHVSPDLDIESIRQCPQLIELELIKSPLKSYDFLSALKSLTKLRIDGAEISSLDQLPVTSAIETLSLEHNLLSSLRGIERFTGLKTLIVPSNQISDIEPLKALKKLKMLGVSYNPIKDWQILTKLPELNSLDIRGTNLNTLDAVTQISSLIELIVDDNHILSLEPITTLENLVVLSFKHNDVASLLPLKKLPRIKEVYASYNSISALSPLPASLEELRLDHNMFTSLASLSEVSRMPGDALNLNYNFIRDLSPLKDGPFLRKIGLSCNRIQSLEIIKDLPKLEELNVRGNRITDISLLAHHPSLYSLDLRQNRIRDFSVLSTIPELLGDYVNLDDNTVGTRIRKTPQTAPFDSKIDALNEWCHEETYDVEGLYRPYYDYIINMDKY